MKRTADGVAIFVLIRSAMENNNENSAALFASRFINNTSQHVFLTGKAGTGKTTFLRQLIKNTHKNIVVAAPTGIAAINAGGVTLHSLFQLPFGSFIPERRGNTLENARAQINDPWTLLRGFHMGRQKRRVLHEMELLVIDEVSMLRADLLDAIDTILRSVRKSAHPFAGVQLLFIGDLLQLPPVVKDEEWQVLQNFYSSIFFFSAKALKNNPPLYIEFEKIYRQDEPEFINVLNNLRNGKLNNEDVQLLNSRYKPGYENKTEADHVYLTTHNYKSDALNSSRLSSLSGKSFFYEGKVTGEFNENSYPVDRTLELKVGSQIMFIKNDVSFEKKFFNGKIGTVTALSEDNIKVICEGESEPIEVSRHEWHNVKYAVNEASNEIEESIAGVFSHYPIKLAWAITVHKSQGLTFTKAILDIGQAFAPGQIYVALSRLTSLKGLILASKIPETIHSQPEEVSKFSETKASESALDLILQEKTRDYLHSFSVSCFNLSTLEEEVRKHCQSYDKDESRSSKQKHKSWALGVLNDIKEIKEPADKFCNQLNRMFSTGIPLEQIHERVSAGKEYFIPLMKKLVTKTRGQLSMVNKESKVKGYTEELVEIDALVFKKSQLISRSPVVLKASMENRALTSEELQDRELIDERKSNLIPVQDDRPFRNREKRKGPGKPKKAKGESAKESFDQFKSGKSIRDIAELRKLTVSTIEGHLAEYIERKELDIKQILSEEKIETIRSAVEESGTEGSATKVKELLGEAASFSEIRFMLAYRRSQKEEAK